MTRRLSSRICKLALLVLMPFAAPGAQARSDIALECRNKLAKSKSLQAGGHIAAARASFLETLKLAEKLPPSEYQLHADVLKAAADCPEMENGDDLYERRIDILLSHQHGVDLMIGAELRELLSRYVATRKDSRVPAAYRKAVRFYGQCMDTSQELKSTCDRGLAEVESIQACYYFMRGELPEAEPLARSVISRPDDSVQPEALLVMLRIYARIAEKNARPDEAATAIERARKLRNRYPRLNTLLPGPD